MNGNLKIHLNILQKEADQEIVNLKKTKHKVSSLIYPA